MRIAIMVISSLHVTQVLFTLSIAYCDFFLSPLLKGCKIAFKKKKKGLFLYSCPQAAL